jgi:hypothetical protein
MRSIVLLFVCACSSKPSTEAKPAAVPAPERGGIDLPGDANGLYWDAGEHALYLTDDTHDTLVQWTDRTGFAQIAQLTATGKISFGGLARGPDGSFVITSFGFGTDGGVLLVDPAHHVTSVPALDKARRRVGIARGPDNAIYDVYFVAANGKHGGGLARLDPTTGETDVITDGLAKPVGIAVTERGIYVSDQDSNTIYAVRDHALQPFATKLANADLLTVLPDGSLVTGGKSGAVVRVALDGTQTTLASGFEQVRGTAYDAVGKRLFVVEHSKATSNHKLHIVPLAL